MKKTGQLLKEAREARGISLNEVAITLKINNKILKGIEEGDASKLPAKTFLRGFIQSYASYLKMDVDTVLKTFQDEMGEKKIEIAPSDSSPSPSEPNPSPSVPKSPLVKEKAKSKDVLGMSEEKWSVAVKAGIVVLALALVGVIVVVKKTIEKYEKESQIVASAANESGNADSMPTADNSTVSGDEADINAAPTTIAPDNTAPMVSSMSPSSTPLATPILMQSAKATPETAVIAASPSMTPARTKPSPSPSASPSPTATPSATPKPTPSATPKPTPSATATPSATPSATPKPSPSATATPKPSATPKVDATSTEKPQEVIIEALDKVEVEFSIDGGETTKLVLNPEQVHTFKAKSKISLKVSDGGAVNIFHNGKDKGPAGDLGKPQSISFP